MKIPEFISQWLIKYWRWFALGVVAIIFSIGYVTLLSGKIASIRTEGLARRNQTIDQLRDDEAYRDTLQASAKAFAEKISEADQSTLEEFIPTGSDFPTLLLTVQDIAKRADLKLTDLFVTEIGQTTAAGSSAPIASSSGSGVAQAATIEGVSLRTQDISVTISGIRSYDNVKALVRVIELSRRLFDVVSIDFDLSSGGESATTTGEGRPINLRLRTYYLPAT